MYFWKAHFRGDESFCSERNLYVPSILNVKGDWRSNRHFQYAIILLSSFRPGTGRRPRKLASTRQGYSTLWTMSFFPEEEAWKLSWQGRSFRKKWSASCLRYLRLLFYLAFLTILQASVDVNMALSDVSDNRVLSQALRISGFWQYLTCSDVAVTLVASRTLQASVNYFFQLQYRLR